MLLKDYDVPHSWFKPTCQFDLKIHATLQYFLPLLYQKTIESSIVVDKFKEWVLWGKERLIKYPVCLKEYWNLKDRVNPYCFVEQLFNELSENQVVVCADGTACVSNTNFYFKQPGVSFHSANTKKFFQ